MGPAVPPPLPPRRRKRRWKKILLWGVLLPVGIVAGLVMMGVVFYLVAEDLPVRDTDRAVLITAPDLAECADWFDPSKGAETVTKKRFLDGSYEIDYEYEHPEADEEGYVWAACTVTVDSTETDARITYGAGGIGSRFGLTASGLEVRDRDDLFSWPPESRCALLTLEDGTIVGNYFTCLVGTKTFEWVVSGMFFDDEEALDALLRPVLRRLRSYEP